MYESMTPRQLYTLKESIGVSLVPNNNVSNRKSGFIRCSFLRNICDHFNRDIDEKLINYGLIIRKKMDACKNTGFKLKMFMVLSPSPRFFESHLMHYFILICCNANNLYP